MTSPRIPVLAALLALPLLLPAQTPIPGGEFKKIQLTDEFWAEGANFGDFNHDGIMDVVYGNFWWEGPDFTKKHEYFHNDTSFKVKQADGTEKTIPGYKGALSTDNAYSKNFFAYTYDFNGDGWTDILILGFPGEQSYWYENPKGQEGPWKQHLALDVTDNESPTFVDVNGDGRPDIVCSSKGFLGYASFDPKDPTAMWTWHPISPKGNWGRFTHGLGVGDVNGDGRMDILEKDGWWEQPASLEGDPVWKKHDAMFGDGGAQMLVYDVNGDGKNDVITSLKAHGFGLVWFEQTNENGVMGWTKHVITGDKPSDNPQGIKFSQIHALALADMNGDGLMDIVTGKRFWAHGPHGDVEPEASPVLYWFELQRKGHEVQWIGHLIDDASGVGTQVVTGDLNGDGKPDVVVGNKRGAFVFLRK